MTTRRAQQSAGRPTPADHLEIGEIRVDHVSRHFRVAHDPRRTLKELLVRRQRSSFTEFRAVDDVSFHVVPGEAVAIVGRNGSGKSTLLKILAGIIPPHSGSIRAGGHVAAMLELGAGFHPDFTGRENVFMNGAIHGIDEKGIRDRLSQIIDFADIGDFIDMPVRTYSSGMKLRLAFAVAAHVDPDILLLDEVLSVGDEAFQAKCLERIFQYRRDGGTLVFVSHDSGSVERVCDRAILMVDGSVEGDGLPRGVLAAYHRSLAEDSGPSGAAPANDPVPEDSGPSGAAPANDPVPDGITDGGAQYWGSGLARVWRGDLSSSGESRSRFSSGDPLRVTVAIYAREHLEQPGAGLQVKDIYGQLCFATDTYMGGRSLAPLEAGHVVEVDLDIPALHLHEGVFTLSLDGLENGIVSHHIEDALTFNVFAASPGTGLVDLSGTWSEPRVFATPHAV